MLAFENETDIEFDPERPMGIKVLLRVIVAWNISREQKLKVSVLQEDGACATVSVENSESKEKPMSIYIRQNGLRWEGYGCSQEPAPTLSNTRAPWTLSAIASTEIEPMADVHDIIDAHASDQFPAQSRGPTNLSTR